MASTLLALFAHPDDESFAAGGTLARYAHAGIRVVLVTATRGEAGIVHDQGVGPVEDMGTLRERELRCACRALGVEEVRLLGYRDSGMAGSPDNDHPRAFCRAEADEVTRRILELFCEFRPDVVLTFGPDGGYGHPDHLAIHRHTSAAWERTADPALCPFPPRKLYYTAISAATFRRLREAMWRQGLIHQLPGEEEIARRGAPEEAITTAIDIRDYLEHKTAALRCHRTQLAPDHPWLTAPPEFRREYMGYEYFSLAGVRGRPGPGNPQEMKETDLFAGLASPLERDGAGAPADG